MKILFIYFPQQLFFVLVFFVVFLLPPLSSTSPPPSFIIALFLFHVYYSLSNLLSGAEIVYLKFCFPCKNSVSSKLLLCFLNSVFHVWGFFWGWLFFKSGTKNSRQGVPECVCRGFWTVGTIMVCLFFMDPLIEGISYGKSPFFHAISPYLTVPFALPFRE